MFWEEYGKYLKSSEWKLFREQYFKLFPKQCKICGSRDRINLHHKSYDNYKTKSFSNYVPLCHSHHDQLTREWRAGARRSFTLEEFTNLFIRRYRG